MASKSDLACCLFPGWDGEQLFQQQMLPKHNTSLSPCYALMLWLCPTGAPLISLTTLLCPDPTGTVPGSRFQESSVTLLREEHVNARLPCLYLPLTCQVAFAGQRELGCMDWNSLIPPVLLLGPDILRKYSQRGRSEHSALFLFSSIEVYTTGDFFPPVFSFCSLGINTIFSLCLLA